MWLSSLFLRDILALAETSANTTSLEEYNNKPISQEAIILKMLNFPWTSNFNRQQVADHNIIGTQCFALVYMFNKWRKLSGSRKSSVVLNTCK